MDPKSISKYINGLSKDAFDGVVTLLLNQVFNFEAVDVDGPGDAGSDMRCFQNSKNLKAWATTLAIQKTISKQTWQEKACEDAEKAVEQLGARVYFFLTSKPHQSGELRRVEQKISFDLGVGATCMGAIEIAGLIHENGLELEFAEVIGLPLDINLRKRPDQKEILLHAFLSLDEDRKHLRNEVYDNALLITLYDLGGTEEPDRLVDETLEMLGLGEAKREHLLGRVDSLRTRQKLLSDVPGSVALSAKTKSDLDISTGIYVEELNAVSAAQVQLIEDKGGAPWSPEDALNAAVFVARMFVQQQLKIAGRASLPLVKTGLSRSLGEPKSELDSLLRKSGLKGERVTEAIEELVKIGADLPLMKKLTSAVTHVAAEGRSVAQACQAIGAASWEDVTVMIDSSVAIPYLCSSFFEPSTGRFSVGANAGVKSLRKLNANLVIPSVYINEIAAHLLSALNAPNEEKFAKASEQSRNGFVAHYFSLRNKGCDVPATVREFVASISPKALIGNGDKLEHIRRVMTDVQPLLRNYGVEFEYLDKFNFGSADYRNYKAPIEQQFDHYFTDRNKRKAKRLIENDAWVLAHQRKQMSEATSARMCLTWDRSVIKVSRELKDCGWVVTPAEAADLVAPSQFDANKLTSLAHSLAKVQITPSVIGANLLDRTTQMAGEKLKDWQFKNRFAELFDRVTSNALLQANAEAWADSQLELFFEEEGIEAGKELESEAMDNEL